MGVASGKLNNIFLKQIDWRIKRSILEDCYPLQHEISYENGTESQRRE